MYNETKLRIAVVPFTIPFMCSFVFVLRDFFAFLLPIVSLHLRCMVFIFFIFSGSFEFLFSYLDWFCHLAP